MIFCVESMKEIGRTREYVAEERKERGKLMMRRRRTVTRKMMMKCKVSLECTDVRTRLVGPTDGNDVIDGGVGEKRNLIER